MEGDLKKPACMAVCVQCFSAGIWSPGPAPARHHHFDLSRFNASDLMARVAPQHTDYGTQQRVTPAKSLEDLDLAKAYESCIPITSRLKRHRSITGVSSHIIYHWG